MPPPAAVTQGGGTLQKMGMGAAMGTGVGLTIGLIFGTTAIMRGGPGPRGTMATLAQYMASSAATFGFFMSIGSVIRTESEITPQSIRAASPYQIAWAQAAQRRNLSLDIKERGMRW